MTISRFFLLALTLGTPFCAQAEVPRPRMATWKKVALNTATIVAMVGAITTSCLFLNTLTHGTTFRQELCALPAHLHKQFCTQAGLKKVGVQCVACLVVFAATFGGMSVLDAIKRA